MAGLRRYGTLYSLGFTGSQGYSVSILNDLMDRHINWTGGHDVRFRDRDGLLRMLCDPEVQRAIDLIVTHTFPMSRAGEAFEVALTKECGKIYLLPREWRARGDHVDRLRRSGCSAASGMYDSYMNEVAVSEARNRLAEVIEESRRSGEPISVTRRGRRVAVILDSDAFDRLVDRADDVEDRRELDAARADDDYVPWDEVKAALGLE